MSRVESGLSYRQDKKIRIAFCDTWGPGSEPDIGVKSSFGIIDPRIPGTKNSFCIGFTYIGGPYEHHRSWEPSGTLYWPDDDFLHDSDTVPQRVSNRTLNRILASEGSSVDHLLRQFLEKNRASK